MNEVASSSSCACVVSIANVSDTSEQSDPQHLITKPGKHDVLLGRGGGTFPENRNWIESCVAFSHFISVRLREQAPTIILAMFNFENS